MLSLASALKLGASANLSQYMYIYTEASHSCERPGLGGCDITGRSLKSKRKSVHNVDLSCQK